MSEDIRKNEAEKPLSREKKSALLRYMAILFAVAFVLVLVSLMLQYRTSNQQITALNESTSNALRNAEQLQTENRELQDEVRALEDEIHALESEKQKLSTDLAVAKAQPVADPEQEDRLEAYEALFTALRCTDKEGNVTYSKAMETVKRNRSLLSESADALYQSLLETE